MAGQLIGSVLGSYFEREREPLPEPGELLCRDPGKLTIFTGGTAAIMTETEAALDFAERWAGGEYDAREDQES